MNPKLSNSRALRIITAAREEFSRRGFDGARVDQIARKAGVNKQLVFYYFHSKRGLFNAVLARGASQLEQALTALPVAAGPRAAPAPPAPAGSAEAHPLDRIRTALATQFDFLAEHPELVALLTQAGRSEARPFAPAIKRLVVLLAEGQGRGLVRDDLDPHLAAAQALVLMVAYLGLESLIAVSAPPLGADEPALRERWKDAAVRLVLEGVAAR
ncbi:MAG TPA: TetR family transcriptional regulator [Gemmatimonadales bacterium]|nr:TetR family transcriptional regulator [Gemmatimonadales bacterium]